MPVSTLKYAEVDGAEITQYTLSNATGISVSIINYGAVIPQDILPLSDLFKTMKLIHVIHTEHSYHTLDHHIHSNAR